MPYPGKNAFQFFLGATGISRAGEKGGLYLLDGLAYDPEPLSAEARKKEKEALVRFLLAYTSIMIGKIIGLRFVFSYRNGANVSVISFLISDH